MLVEKKRRGNPHKKPVSRLPTTEVSPRYCLAFTQSETQPWSRKMKYLKYAALTAALTALFAFCAIGQEWSTPQVVGQSSELGKLTFSLPTAKSYKLQSVEATQVLANPFPNNLMFGPGDTFLDNVISKGPIGLFFQAGWTNILDQKTVSNFSRGVTNLDSYAEVKDLLHYIRNRLYNEQLLRRDNLAPSPTTTISFSGVIYRDFYPDHTSQILIFFKDNFGRVADIDTNQFTNVSISYALDFYPVQRLDWLKITIPNKFDYSWTSGSYPVAKYQLENLGFTPIRELSITNGFGVSQWYANGEYTDMRFSVSADGYTVAYTGYGDKLEVKLECRPHALVVRMARGSDTTVEASTDLQTWLPLAHFGPELGISEVTIPLEGASQLFFRASSK